MVYFQNEFSFPSDRFVFVFAPGAGETVSPRVSEITLINPRESAPFPLPLPVGARIAGKRENAEADRDSRIRVWEYMCT